MTVAYLDSSALVAIAFGERGARATARRLEGFDELFSANQLEAEVRASLVREGVAAEPEFLKGISWVLPNRPLTPELTRALAAGYLRGADLWHVACALYLARDPGEVAFVTHDRRQRAVARKLGFRIPPTT